MKEPEKEKRKKRERSEENNKKGSGKSNVKGLAERREGEVQDRVVYTVVLLLAFI